MIEPAAPKADEPLWPSRVESLRPRDLDREPAAPPPEVAEQLARMLTDGPSRVVIEPAAPPPAPSTCVNCGHVGTYHDSGRCMALMMDAPSDSHLFCGCETFRAVGAAPPPAPTEPTLSVKIHGLANVLRNGGVLDPERCADLLDDAAFALAPPAPTEALLYAGPETIHIGPGNTITRVGVGVQSYPLPEPVAVEKGGVYDVGLDDGVPYLRPHVPPAPTEDVAALVALRKPGRHLSAYDEGWNDALDIAEQRLAADLADKTADYEAAIKVGARWGTALEEAIARADLAESRVAAVRAERDRLQRDALRTLAAIITASGGKVSVPDNVMETVAFDAEVATWRNEHAWSTVWAVRDSATPGATEDAENERLLMVEARWQEAEESGYGWKTRAEVAEDRIRQVREEIAHAYANRHRLDPACQGYLGDARDAAVRISHIQAALSRGETPGESAATLQESEFLAGLFEEGDMTDDDVPLDGSVLDSRGNPIDEAYVAQAIRGTVWLVGSTNAPPDYHTAFATRAEAEDYVNSNGGVLFEIDLASGHITLATTEGEDA